MRRYQGKQRIHSNDERLHINTENRLTTETNEETIKLSHRQSNQP